MPLFSPNYDSMYWRSEEFLNLKLQTLQQLHLFLSDFTNITSEDVTEDEEFHFQIDLNEEQADNTERLFKKVTSKELQQAFLEPIAEDMQETGLQLLFSKLPTSPLLTDSLDLIYDEIIQPALFTNNLSLREIIRLMNLQFTSDTHEESTAYLQQKICIDIIHLLSKERLFKPIKQFVQLPLTEIFTGYFIKEILSDSGLFNDILEAERERAQEEDVSIEQIEGEYCEAFFVKIFLPLNKNLTLFEKLVACQQWLDIDVVQQRKDYYFHKILKEVLLPSFEKNQGKFSHLTWNKISDAFLGGIIEQLRSDSPLLRQEILQSILETNPEKLLGLSLGLDEDILPLLTDKNNCIHFSWDKVSDYFIFLIISKIIKKSPAYDAFKLPILDSIFKKNPSFIIRNQEKLLVLPKLSEEFFLPLFQSDINSINNIPWSQVNKSFIDNILFIIHRTTQYQHLEKEILEKLIEQRIDYFTTRTTFFLEFREALLKLSASFVLKNFNKIILFIKTNYPIRIEGLKILSSALEPYNRLIDIPWNEISDENINAILAYTKETENDELAIVVLKGALKHKNAYFINSDDYKEIAELFQSISQENNYLAVEEIFQFLNETWLTRYSEKINIAIFYQLLERVGWDIFISKIPEKKLSDDFLSDIIILAKENQNAESVKSLYNKVIQSNISYFAKDLTRFLQLPNEVIIDYAAKIIDEIIIGNPDIADKQKRLNQLLVLSSVESDILQEEILRINRLLDFFSRPVPNFSSDIKGYFQSVLYNLNSSQISIDELKKIVKNNIIPICYSNPEHSYVFLETLEQESTHQLDDELYQLLTELTTIALASSFNTSTSNKVNEPNDIKRPQRPSAVADSPNSVVLKKEDDFSSIATSHVAIDYRFQFLKEMFELKLKKAVFSPGENNLVSLFNYWQNLITLYSISKEQAQELLRIFHQQLSFLNKPKHKVTSLTFFGFEKKDIKTIQENLCENIDRKNTKIAAVLKQFGENNALCKMLAILINIADNILNEEKKCSDDSLFQQLYPNSSFQKYMIGSIQESFNSSMEARRLSPYPSTCLGKQ